VDPVALGRFAGRRVAIVGDVILDRYIKGAVERISPEAPVPIVRVQGRDARPGGAANVAANVLALGAIPLLCATIGDDGSGRRLRDELAARGIAGDRLIEVPGRPTTVKTRVVAHQQQVVRLDSEDTSPVPPASGERVLQAALAALDGADALVVSDYAKGLLSRQTLGPLLAAARTRGMPVVVDPKARDFGLYTPATVLTPNLGEACRAAGRDSRDVAGEAAVLETARGLLAGLDLDALLVTLGDAGMLVCPRSGAPEWIRARAREVFDVTGAGDTVVAVLGVGLAAGLPLETAARWANAAAAIAVGRFGTAAVTANELRKFHETA
jgi:D-beta-D-heptose 7-phosphate kinase/D-beta-D-heptose 1-phosphate adenosyltransferase